MAHPYYYLPHPQPTHHRITTDRPTAEQADQDAILTCLFASSPVRFLALADHRTILVSASPGFCANL
jgi:hypothetical protein